MEVFRGAVTVTSSVPLTSATGYLFYYAPIHPVAVSQSVILTSILESSGHAQLPSSVPLPEFELWQKAVVDREAGNLARNNFSMNMGSVCTLLRAADGVGDVKFDQWVSLAWTLLYKLLSPAQWGIQKDIDSFLKLPEHIQHLIFMAGARSHKQTEALGKLLRTLPHCVHSAIFLAFVGPQKTLFVPGEGSQKEDMLPFFQSLTNLPAEPPSVQSLVDSHQRRFQYSDKDGDSFTAAAAAALRHHSGLTSLSLSQLCSSPGRMQLLAPAVAALTALKTLHLGAGEFLISPAALSTLPDALQSMQMLQHLTLQLRSKNPDPPKNPAYGRFKAARKGAHPEPSPVCAASPCNEHVLRLLPHLTRLTFLSIYSSVPSHVHDETANSSMPINMPQLRALHLPGQHNCLAAQILTKLEAPVVAAGISLFWMAQLQPQYPQQLCEGLQKLVHLTNLRLNLIRSDAHLPSAHVPAVFTQLQKLKTLKIQGPFPIVCAALSSTVAGVTMLSFHMTHSDKSPVEEAAAISLWEQTCAAISVMALSHLDVHLQMHFESYSLPGISSLSRLTGLTMMSLNYWRSCLAHPADREALSRMKQLQSLHLVGIGTHDAVLPSVRDAMVGLAQLISLRVRTCFRDQHAFIPTAAVAQRIPDGAWQHLVHLDFPVPSVQAARELVVACALLPSLQRLLVQAAGRIELSETQRADLMSVAAGTGFNIVLVRFQASEDGTV